MNYLEELFYMLEEEREPDTAEYRENQAVRHSLSEKIRQAMGEEMVEKVAAVYAEREEQQSRRFFLLGLRFGLELLRLL